MQRKTALQVCFVNARLHRARGNEWVSLRASDRPLNVTRNAAGHIALQRQHVLQFAIICTGPQVLVRIGSNQLNADTNLVSRSQY